ncbi:ribonuclease P protein component [candidate division WOR-3 bacterium]|uniref:Ribonuclease P protein component n=1 Tax=candidate division WOR-3 bacterium TaxID=2052148 RepID=A0A660SHL1_UNCW3|nr:MAG: ribonuclease P protein component [candidate division WOR-3 bacterium]
MLPKEKRLKRQREFIQVYRKGKVCRIDPLTVHALPASDLKVAFVVPKSVGKAVVRNRLKRRLSEAVRLNQDLFQNHHLIFRIEKDALPEKFSQLEELIRKVARGIYDQGPDPHN